MLLVILMIKLIFKLLQTNTYVSRIRKAFANGSSANLMKTVLKPLAKSVLISLGLKQQHHQQMQLFIRKCLDLVIQH